MSIEAQSFFRISYGILLLGTLVSLLPHARRFFLSEKWGGYSEVSLPVNLIQNPWVLPPLLAVWIGSSLFLIAGWWTVPSALVNLLISRYFFVQMRWRGVLRGMGAPGFMTYWLAAACFLLEYTVHYAPRLRELALWVIQVDFALIMITSGLYKLNAGYAKNEGMEYGLVNPEWGTWWRFYSKLSPQHGWFRFQNQMAWLTQILAGILMLIPQTRIWGAFLIFGSFLYIFTQIRLGLLCEMVMLGGILFFTSASPSVPLGASQDFYFLNSVLQAGLWAYLILLPMAYGGLCYNFYAKKSLPFPFQQLLEKYTNLFGIILWRVFSVDVINFFILIYRAKKENVKDRTLVSRYGWSGGLRYSHVGESITLTSLFTALKYYSSNKKIFRDRLLRYAKTVSCPEDSVLIFEYVSIVKQKEKFQFVPAREYIVDPVRGEIEEKVIDESIRVDQAHPDSPVHEAVRPGTYVPLVSEGR